MQIQNTEQCGALQLIEGQTTIINTHFNKLSCESQHITCVDTSDGRYSCYQGGAIYSFLNSVSFSFSFSYFSFFFLSFSFFLEDLIIFIFDCKIVGRY